jgi:hypothetical protein
MIKSGSTAWQIIKPGVDLGLIDSIIITYKTLPGYGSRVLLQKRYPDDTRVNGDELLLPLSQADTTLLREEGGDRVRLELQYNYSSGAVAKSEIQTVHIGDTLATAYVDGSNPDEAQIEGLPIEFAAGDAIVIESKNECVKDWNENDPESEKYIEGRTHYKKPTYPSDAPMIETLTAGATLLYDFTGLSATYINRILYENATDPDGQYPFEWSFEIKLSTGWRAAESTSAGNGFAEKIDDANFRIMGNKTYDFYLYFISDPALLTPEYANRFPKKGIYVTVNDAGTANIRNFKAGFVAVAQLKRNYIPDSIARTADVVSRQQLTADAGKALVIGEDGVVKPGDVGDATTEPAEDDIPKVYIDGEIPTTKDDVLAEMTYISKGEKFNAYLEIKCQGSSSMSYPKKNFTIKMYSDEARETKLKKAFRDWGVESNKFVLKANYIDHSHARNIVSANLWNEVVSSRSDYDALPEEMQNSPRNGAIDGFPIKVYTNGTYQGIYTWNIGKEDWMWGMDEDNPNHVLLCGEKNTDGTYSANACNFRALWSGTNEDCWSVEVGTNSNAVKSSLNNLIGFVMDNDGDSFRSGIGQYLDVQSAIDYFLFSYVTCGLDSLAKNMLLATYDGTKWICGQYDMDSTFGLWWNGQSFVSAEYRCPEDYQEQFSLLWERIKSLYVAELKARYAELRGEALSLPNMVTHFERFMDTIGLDLYAEDLTVYNTIPSGSTNNIKQIRNYIRDRLTYVDAQIEALIAEVPCTGISLSASELTFTEAGTQTLTANVEPTGCTDEVVWASNDNSIASVSDGVVTAKANGNATITVTCGGYSASCEVSVSGIESGTEETQGEYVTDGLYAHLDARDVQSGATTWTSRTNDIEFSMTGFGDGAVGENCVTFNGAQTVACSNGMSVENGATIEYLVYIASDKSCNRIFYQSDRLTSGMIGTGHAVGWGGGYGFFCDTAGSGKVFALVGMANSTHTVSIALLVNGTKKIYIDGTLYNSGETLAPVNFDKLILGYNSNFPGEGFDGKLYSFRAYNRVLSDAEILQNYEADCSEFGVTTPPGDSDADGDAVAVYELPADTEFATSSDAVNTNVLLWDEDKSFTLAFDITPNYTQAVERVVFATNHTGPYQGIKFSASVKADGFYSLTVIGNATVNSETVIPNTCATNIRCVIRHIKISGRYDYYYSYNGTNYSNQINALFVANKIPLWIGGDNGWTGTVVRPWAGTMHSFTIYEGAMSEAEITAFLNG